MVAGTISLKNLKEELRYNGISQWLFL